MKIIQETIKVKLPQVSSVLTVKVQKYHISKKGTARLNKHFDWYNQLKFKPKIIKTFELDVKKVV